MTQPDSSATQTHHVPTGELSPALEDGLRLVVEEQESAGLSPLALWLAKYPRHAEELANFLATERDLRGQLTPADVRGTTVAEFELRAELGRGGMGVVYLAYDQELKREVALKQLPASHTLTARERARFQFEAEMVASLDHPNIVRVYRFGEWNGSPYLVMPVIDGGSLADRLNDLGTTRLSFTAIAQLVQGIALGVQHAHERGLLHRDLKPANILLDREGRPHVADFGLARRLDASVTAIAGTASYMSPEQARGEKHLTTATDIHAIGAILFELLTGEPPYGKGDLASVLRRVSDDPVPPIRRYLPKVPAGLEYIGHKCLEKEPRDRYPSAQALADDLTRFLAGEAVGQAGRGTCTNVLRALERRRDSFRDMPSWPIAFWAAGNSLVGTALLQWAVVVDPAGWFAQAALAFYMLSWLVVVWLFWMRQATALTRGEVGTMVLHIGTFIAMLSITVTQLGQHDGNILPLFPIMGAIIGFALFAHGLVFWGRLYLVGLIATLIATTMPLWPSTIWPSIFGLTVSLAQLWAGLHLRRSDEES